MSNQLSPRAIIELALAAIITVGVALGVGLGYGLKERIQKEQSSTELTATVTRTALSRHDNILHHGLKSDEILVQHQAACPC